MLWVVKTTLNGGKIASDVTMAGLWPNKALNAAYPTR